MLQSHTATQQWQSFEMRMRQRRVERCLLRASVAIEAGVLEDAREAIDEVRRLSPNEPALDQLASQLAEAEKLPAITQLPELMLQPDTAAVDASPAPVAGEEEGRRLPVAAAAVLLAMISGGGAWWWSATHVAPAPAQGVAAPTVPRTTSAPPPAAAPSPAVQIDQASVTAAVHEEIQPEAATATTGSVLPASSAQPAPAPTTATGVAGGVPAGVMSDRSTISVPTPRPADAPEPRAAVIDARNSAPAGLPGVENTPTAPPAPKVEPPVPAVLVESAPRVVSGADGIGEPAAAPRALPTAPAAPAPSAPASIGNADEQGVRTALSRYESAYTRLDAAAAATVFPGINQRALATAFDGLSAQTISLGRCDVRVTGPTAQAYCEGRARWTPKVGGGAKTAERVWRFDLRNANGNWVITQATAK